MTAAGQGAAEVGQDAVVKAEPTDSTLGLSEIYRSESSGCGDLPSSFPPLPATLHEVDAVADLWTQYRSEDGHIVRLTGRHASEHEFKRSAPGKRVIHLATHGFFLDGQCAPSTVGTRGPRRNEASVPCRSGPSV